MDPLGLCLDPIASSMNHSCDPNVSVVFDGPRLVVQALRPIKKDDELFISYVDATWPYERRQAELHDRYFFDCACSACVKGPTGHTDIFLDERSSRNPCDVEQSVLELMSQARPSEGTASLSLLLEALRKCEETKIWPSHRQPLPEIRRELFLQHIKSEHWAKALQQGLYLYFFVYPILHPQPFHPTRVIHVWTMAKIALYIASEGDDSVKSSLGVASLDLKIVVLGLLLEAEDNVKRSHGEDTRFAKVVHKKAEEIKLSLSQGEDPVIMKLQIPQQWELLRQLALRGEKEFT
ncbi:hypothetical protein MRB53_042034 [Persea americana]|nr:hypothetical protein MRB53_042034 [Persea americana]